MLYLYKNINPNKDRLNVLYFTDFEAYKYFLSNYLVKTITNDKYTINTESIRLQVDETLTQSILDEITYIIDEEGNYKRCFYVNSFNYQSGYAYFNLSIDLWGSYIYKASFALMIQESTRQFTYRQGLIERIYNYKFKSFDGNVDLKNRNYLNASIEYFKFVSSVLAEEINNDDVYVVFSIKHNIYQTNDGAVSTISMYYASVRELKEAWVNAGTSEANKLVLSRYNDLEVVKRLLSGVYGCAYNSSDALNIKAELINAWLIPYNMLSDSVLTKQYIACRTGDARNSNNVLLYINELAPSMKYIDAHIHSIDYDKYNVNIVGVKGLGLPLQNAFYENVFFKTCISNEKVNVVICQGDNQKDITEAFNLTLTQPTGDVTQSREMVTILSRLVNVLGGTASLATGVAGAVTGNPLALLGGIIGTGRSATGLLEESIKKPFASTQVGVGSGFANFFTYQTFGNNYNDNCKQPLANPFCVVSFNTNIDKNLIINMALLYDNLYIKTSNIATIGKEDIVIINTPYAPQTYAPYRYLKAYSEVTGVCNDACKFIAEKLSEGVAFTYLTQTHD